MYLVTRLLYFYIHFLVYGFIVILKLKVSVNYPTLSRITLCPTLPHQPPIYRDSYELPILKIGLLLLEIRGGDHTGFTPECLREQK